MNENDPTKIDVARARRQTRPVGDVLSDLDRGIGHRHKVLPTGFEPFDSATGGGLRTRELVVVGGVPGIGKTALTLQWARNMAAAGSSVVFACYEHDHSSLLTRLLLLEVGLLVEGDTTSSHMTREAVQAVSRGETTLADATATNLLLRAARARIEGYGMRLHLLGSDALQGTVDTLAGVVAAVGADALFVDYLQKVPSEEGSDDQQITGIASRLKDIALEHGALVVAAVAGDRQGLDSRRTRLRDMRGASGIAYEADMVVMLNEKYRSVSKLHSAYDPVSAETYRNLVILSVDKNRSGPSAIDMQHSKDLMHFRFEHLGSHVEERLIDDHLFPE